MTVDLVVQHIVLPKPSADIGKDDTPAYVMMATLQSGKRVNDSMWTEMNGFDSPVIKNGSVPVYMQNMPPHTYGGIILGGEGKTGTTYYQVNRNGKPLYSVCITFQEEDEGLLSLPDVPAKKVNGQSSFTKKMVAVNDTLQEIDKETALDCLKRESV